MEHWWNHIDRETEELEEKTCPYRLVYHKSHMPYLVSKRTFRGGGWQLTRLIHYTAQLFFFPL